MFGLFTAAVSGSRCLIGLDSLFVPIRFVMFIMRVRFVSFAIRCSGGCLDGSRIGQGHGRQRLARLNIAMLVISMIVLIVNMFMIVRVLVILMMLRIGMMMFGLVGVIAFAVRMFRVFLRVSLAFLTFMWLSGQRLVGARVLDDVALEALAAAAAARIAVARTAAIGAAFALLLGLAMGAFIRLDQRLAIGDRNLIIVGVDFAEGQKAVTVATIFDEGGLKRRLYARDLGEVDV